jgi:hypothetical protein
MKEDLKKRESAARNIGREKLRRPALVPRAIKWNKVEQNGQNGTLLAFSDFVQMLANICL